MKVVKFEALRIEGFSSIAVDTTIELSGAGITMIKGENGVGKTTMFSALAWCLYGINLKGVNADKVQSWAHIRTEQYRGTRVAIQLTVGSGKQYFIVRNLNFNGATFEVKQRSGVLIFEKTGTGYQLIPDHPQHIKDCNQWIEELMGMNSQLFLNSVLFGQRMKRLVESSGEEKRALFEGIFNLDFIATLKKNADAKAQELNASVQNYVSKNSMAQAKLDSIDEQLKQLELAKAEFDKNKLQRVQAAEEQVQAKISTLSKAKEGLLQLQEQTKAAKEQETKKQAVELKISKLKKDVELVKGSGDQKLEHFEKVKTMLAEDKEKARAAYTSKMDEVNRLKESKLDLQEQKSGFDRDVKKYADTVNELEAELLALKKGLTEIKTNCTVCGAPVKPEELKAAKANINKQIKETQTNLDIITDKLPSIISQRDSLAAELDALDAGVNAAYENSLNLKEAVNKCEADILAFSVALNNNNSEIVTNSGWEEDLKEYRGWRRQQSEIETQIALLNAELSEFESYDDVASSIVAAEKLIQDCEYEVKSAKDKVLHIQAEEPVEVDTTEIKANKQNIALEIQQNEEAKAEKAAELEKVTFWQKACGASGVKAYVFSAMFGLLNDAVVKYASRLGIMVTFGIDNSKASKPFITQCFMDGKVVDYDELSGGQKQRVDIALAFATHDVVSVNTSVSLLIMDEVFEGLDSSGIETAFDLIRVKAGDSKKVFVITHSNEIDGLGTKSITLKRHQWGYTEIGG